MNFCAAVKFVVRTPRRDGLYALISRNGTFKTGMKNRTSKPVEVLNAGVVSITRTVGRLLVPGGESTTVANGSERNGGVVASFPVKPGEQLMLVTDQGKMIRTTVGDIRIMGRNTQGVTIFRVAEGERVVSVAKIEETDDDIEVEADDELAPEEGAVVGEDLASGSEK